MQRLTQLSLARQRGIVLVSSLLLLVVVTIMALSIFRSFGMQEKIAGNMREKQRALQSAVSGENYAEWWLATVSNAPIAVGKSVGPTAARTCSGSGIINANASPLNVLICAETMKTLGITNTTVPWPIGAQYAPPGMNVTGSISNALVPDTYYTKPMFYITDLGAVLRGSGELYQVDAYSYGLSAATVAVVESTVAITCQVCDLTH